MFHLRSLSFVLFFVSLVFARSTATAQLTWNGSAGGFLWNLDPSNQIWRNPSLQNVGWTNGSDASFGGGFNTASVAAAIVAGTVTFSNSFTLEDGGGTLQASAFSVSSGFAVRINAVLAGTTGFTKTGGGRLELNAANTVSGTVNINQGGIDILAADALRNATVSVNVIGGIALATNANFGGLAGTSSFDLAQRTLTVGYNNLNSTFSGNLSGNHPNANATTFTKVGSGTLTITGNWSGLAGRREINGGFVAINGLTFLDELVTINGGGLRFDSDLTVSSAFNISRGGATTFDTNGHTVSYFGSLAGNGAFTKTGAGTLTLVPSNIVATTDVSILGGTLSVNNKNNIGPFAADRTFTLDGGTFSDGFNGGENFSSAVVLGSGGGTIEVRDPLGDLFFSGSFSGAGGLTKTGAGTLNLGTAASYLGATTVTGGTLRTFAAAALPTNTALSVSNASVILDRAQSIGSLAGQSSTVEIKLGALSIGGNNTSTEFSGVLTGGGSVVKNGSGALILSGANTFSGALTLNAGTLTLSGSNTYALGTTVNGGSLVSPGAGGLPGNSALTINGGSVDLSLLNTVFLHSFDSIAGTGGTLQLGNMQLTLTGNASTSYAGTILGGTAASLTKTGSGIFTLSGSTSVDEITINAGTLQLGNSGAVLADNGNVALGATATLRLGAADETLGAVTGAGVIDLGSGAARTLKLNGTVETAFSYNGVIQGTGNLHLAFGSSSVTYTLSGTNTYGGTTFVESGELRTGTSGTVLPDTTALGLGANGRLGLGSNEIIGSLAGVSGSVVFLNGHTLTAGGTNLDSAFAGRLHGAGGLTKAGTGTLTLTGNSSTYTGTTTVNAGTLDAAGSGALGSGTTSVTSAGILLVSGPNTSITNAVSNSGGLVRVFNGASASNVSVSNSGVAEVNGTIGTLTLNGGTLRGGGTVTGGVMIDSGDILRPGNSAGQITVGNLTLGAGGRYVFELRDATGAMGVGYDSVLNLGALAITAGTTSGTQFTIAITTLNNSNQPGLASNFNNAQPFSFVLVQNASGVTGFDPARFTIDSTGFQNSLNGGSFALALSGNNLVLNFAPVPEPGTGTLLAIALGGAAAIRFLRSRRQR